MVTTPQYITVRQETIVTMQLPRTIFNLTDAEAVAHCVHHYYRLARSAAQYGGDLFPVGTLQLVAEAMVDGGAVTVLYRNEKGEGSARTIFPHSITLTGDNHLTTWGYCTYRRECRSFRLDKMDCVQLVTTPAEAAA
jgi:hypothetical protein